MKQGLDIQGRVSGKKYVVEDVQKRCHPESWVVITQGDGTMLGDTVQHGIFWRKEDAELFLQALLAKETDLR